LIFLQLTIYHGINSGTLPLAAEFNQMSYRIFPRKLWSLHICKRARQWHNKLSHCMHNCTWKSL